MKNVLVTAIGCPGGVSIIQSLREDSDIFLVGTDMRKELPGKYLVDRFYQTPAGKSDDYINFMLDLIMKENIDVILPLATYELYPLSKNKQQFEENGCRICVSDVAQLKIANNRWLLYEKFKNCSFIPEYTRLVNGDDLEKVLSEFGYPGEKVVIKPFVSHGSIGLRIIDSNIDLYEHFREEKPSSIYISYDMAKKILKGKKFNDLLVTEYLPGKEYGVDLLIDPSDGKIVDKVVRDNGEVFHSEICGGKLIDYPEITRISESIVDNLKLSYTVNIDFKLDKDNKPKVIEINPRLPATSFLAYSAGLNLPLLSVKLALGEEITVNQRKKELSIYSYRGFIVVDKEGKLQDFTNLPLS